MRARIMRRALVPEGSAVRGSDRAGIERREDFASTSKAVAQASGAPGFSPRHPGGEVFFYSLRRLCHFLKNRFSRALSPRQRHRVLRFEPTGQVAHRDAPVAGRGIAG